MLYSVCRSASSSSSEYLSRSNCTEFSSETLHPSFSQSSLYRLLIPGYGVQAALAPQLKQWNAILAPVVITPPRLRFSLQMGQLKVTQPLGVLLCLAGRLSKTRRCVRSTMESIDISQYNTLRGCLSISEFDFGKGIYVAVSRSVHNSEPVTGNIEVRIETAHVT